MKKILLTCMMMLLGWSSYAQIIVNEGFEGTSTPTGFAYTSFSRTTVSPRFCNGVAAVARNFWSSGPSGNIVYSSTASNATAMNVSFNYKALEYNVGTGIGGTFKAEYSVDNGTTYTQLGSDIVLSAITPCTPFTGVIPAGTIPAAASFKFRISGAWSSGDYYFIIDDVQLAQTTTSAPVCTIPILPANAATGVSVTPTLTWGASAGTSAYLLNLGTTSGGTNALNAYNAGTSTSYAIPSTSALMYSTTYYFTVAASNNIGTTPGCSETSFTTLAIPCPTVSAPAVNATNQSLKPTITWAAVTGVTGYRLSVGTTAGGTDILNASNLGNVTSYTFPSNLTVSTQYFYTVTSYQGANTSTGCTERKFTTGAIAPPANDDCASAITMTVNPDLACGSVVAGNTLGATLSMAATPCFGNPDDDVWYKFVATNATAQISLTNVVSTGTSTTTDMYFQVLSGVCGTQTSLLCSDPDTGIVNGLTIGATYYVRVYTYSGTGYNASFNICVGTPPPPPANDDCAAAVALTVNADYSCGSVTAGTTVSATQSTETAPSCASSGTNDDVWYKFTATNVAHRISLTNITGGTTDMAMAIYSGACGSLVAMQCSDPETMNVTGLTVGTEYKVRVWTYTSTSSTTASFNICVGTEPPPPANDDCAGAVNLTVNPDLACGAVTAGSTESATASTETAPTCSATGINDDVWYTFTATNAAHRVTLLNLTGSSTSMAMQAYSGSCGSLVAVTCVSGSTLNLTGLTVGTLYTVRVYTSASTATSRASFNICVGTPPPPPANDDCGGALALTAGATFAQNAIVGDNTASTTGAQLHSCGSVANSVWYSVTVPASGSITIETGASTAAINLTDTIMTVYSGACGTLTEVGCNDDIGGGSVFSKVALTGLNAGDTLFISIWSWASATIKEGSFQISAYDGSLATGETIVKDDRSFTIAPNPFTDVVRISDVNDVVSISVVDLSGRIVKTVKPAREINLGDLKTGMYLINLKMKDGSVKTVKAIKK